MTKLVVKDLNVLSLETLGLQLQTARITQVCEQHYKVCIQNNNLMSICVKLLVKSHVKYDYILVSFIKRCLFTDLCQTRVGRRYDKTNVKW